MAGTEEGIFQKVLHGFDPIFGPFFNTMGDPFHSNVVGVFIMALVVSLIITVITAKLVDQTQMKKNKARMKEFQAKMKEAQKKGSQKELAKIQKEMMEVQGAVMKNTMRPMMFTMIPIIIIFSWMNTYLPREIIVVYLPFDIILNGTDPNGIPTFGWFGWYILSSFGISPVIKKILNIEGP